MSDEQEDIGDATRTAVFEAAVEILEERRDEGKSEITEWATASEIATRTGIAKVDVVAALESLAHGRLYLGGEEGDDERVVIGVDHRHGYPSSAEGAGSS